MGLAARSVEVIEASQHPSGAFPASPTYPTYRYCWIRDGAFIADAMDVSGRPEQARAFHRWVARTVLRYRDRVEPLERDPPARLDDGSILHPRFTFDGDEVPGHWSNFQLDCYGFWLTSVGRHARAHGRPDGVLPAVEVAARYLGAVWKRPSADCWEEHEGERHPASLCAAAAGLREAAALLGDARPAEGAEAITAWVLERGTAGAVLTKTVGSTDVDGSALLVLGPYGPFEPEDPLVGASLEAVEEALVVGGGGVHRYLGDGFYGGGLWVPLAGALAWIHALRGRHDRAREALAWIEGTADPEGHLPEQTSDDLRMPRLLDAWTQRWGPVARPLLWSQAMYLIARDALGDDRG